MENKTQLPGCILQGLWTFLYFLMGSFWWIDCYWWFWLTASMYIYNICLVTFNHVWWGSEHTTLKYGTLIHKASGKSRLERGGQWGGGVEAGEVLWGFGAWKDWGVPGLHSPGGPWQRTPGSRKGPGSFPVQHMSSPFLTRRRSPSTPSPGTQTRDVCGRTWKPPDLSFSEGKRKGQNASTTARAEGEQEIGERSL